MQKFVRMILMGNPHTFPFLALTSYLVITLFLIHSRTLLKDRSFWKIIKSRFLLKNGFTVNPGCSSCRIFIISWTIGMLVSTIIDTMYSYYVPYVSLVIFYNYHFNIIKPFVKPSVLLSFGQFLSN